MSATTIEELIEKWTLAGKRPLAPPTALSGASDFLPVEETFKSLLQRLEFYEERFYSRFVPSLFPPHNPNYFERLLRWLTNDHVTEDDQRIMFQIACGLAYFSFEDFLQLYRSAFIGPVARWIVDLLKLSIDDPSFSTTLSEQQKQRTWYCPITDSMVISEFYHANHISGIGQRPGFRALRDFGDASRLKEFMAKNYLERLVLLEDFVGTGTQSASTVHWAVQHLQCPVLFVPLVICPDGVETFDRLAASLPAGSLTISPVIELDSSAFIHGPDRTPDPFIDAVELLANSLHPHIIGHPDTSYGPMGFKQPADAYFGSSLVLFSNTPDNSLPLIHHHRCKPSKWNALFPRVSRETT